MHEEPCWEAAKTHRHSHPQAAELTQTLAVTDTCLPFALLPKHIFTASHMILLSLIPLCAQIGVISE